MAMWVPVRGFFSLLPARSTDALLPTDTVPSRSWAKLGEGKTLTNDLGGFRMQSLALSWGLGLSYRCYVWQSTPIFPPENSSS